MQTPEYARALFEMRQPPYSREEVERVVAARMARQSIFERAARAGLSFVQEEVTLRRPLGGRMVLRRQLEHLLEVGQLRNVDASGDADGPEEHAGLDGRIQV